MTTLFGRRRFIGSRRRVRDASGRLGPLSEHAERQAVNSVVQGSAADVVKRAMINVDAELSKHFGRPLPFAAYLSKNANVGAPDPEPRGARLVLHMHDELVMEVARRDLKQVASIVKLSMENAVQLKVPMPVKVKAGPNWADQQPVNI